MGTAVHGIRELLNQVSQCCRLDLDHLLLAADSFLGESHVVWEDPSGECTIPPGEIHVWRAWLDQPALPFDRLGSVLSQDELVRASRFHFEKDRARFVARRGLLRMILGRYLRVEPALLRFNYGVFGKPAVAFPSDSGLQFNLSHSDELALYAVTAQSPVGVDVERMRMIAEADAIVVRYFSAREVADWRSRPPSEKPQVFLRYWARKEAGSKVDGRGIAKTLVPHAPHTTAVRDDDPLRPDDSEAKADCIVWDLIPSGGYIASVALRYEGGVK